MENNGFKPGQWITNWSQIGVIKNVDNWDDEILLDIVLYDRTGGEIGRESPAGNGPKGFEPCCSADGWVRIEEPEFPLKRNHYLNELLMEIKP